MQCLRTWFTIWLFAISVNNSVASPVASPVDILNVDNKNVSVSVISGCCWYTQCGQFNGFTLLEFNFFVYGNFGKLIRIYAAAYKK